MKRSALNSVIMPVIWTILSACYHYTPVISRKDPDRGDVRHMFSKVQVGKLYVITLRDNSAVIAKALVVDKDRMSGEVETFRSKITRIFTVDDIVDIRERKFSVVKTAIAIVAPTTFALWLMGQSFKLNIGAPVPGQGNFIW